MALIVADRVRETTTTVGTGAFALGGAQAGFQAFSAVLTNGDTTYYACAGTTEWEVGVGTWNTGNTLSRTTILASSNGGSIVNFSAGAKDIFISYPASRSVYQNEAGTSTVQQAFSSLSATSANITTATITSGTVSTTPASGNDIANKTYVDTTVSSGITYHSPVKYEVPNSTGNLNAIYNQPGGPGVGVGATLTNNGTLAAFAPDGPTAAPGDRILVYNQTNAFENGVYTVTTVGNGSTPWVLTRATDADTYAVKSPNGLGLGDAFFITSGNTGAGETYVCNTSGTITFGTTAINFVQVSSAQIYSAGTGLTLSGTQFSITNTGVGAATYGSASSVPVIGVNAQGQITSATNTTIAITGAQVSGNIAGSAGSVANALTAGSYLTSGGTYDGSVARTFAVDATSANTASKVVARDASGNFSAGTITASLSGNATSANTSTNISGGAANQIPYQASAGTTTFVAAPTIANTYLGWTGSAYTWAAFATPNSLTFNNGGAGGASGSTFNGSSALTVSYNTVGAPSTTGTNASGTWSINITGNAASATTAAKTSATTVPASTAFSKWLFATTSTGGTLDWNDSTNTIPGVGTTLLLGSATNGPGGGNYYHPFNIEYAGINGTGNVTQMAVAYGSPANELYMRGSYSGSWTSWVRFLNSNNYNSYAPTLTGGGASGTWNINITGSAGSASSVPWTGVSAGTRTNYVLGFQPPASSYSGFYFSKSTSAPTASDAGYFLIRGTSDSFSPYTAEGITLVSDANSLNLFARGSSLVAGGNAWVRMGTGSSETFRLQSDFAYALNSSRAPIFYDSDNTGYYLDPTSTTSLRTVGDWRADSAAWTGEFSGKIQYHSSNWYFQYASQYIFRNSGGTNVAYGDTSGNSWSIASYRAPIFYDSDDTGYYLNPNSTSNLNNVLLNNGLGAYADGAGNDPYGFISVTRGTGANYAYYGLTRSGQFVYQIGIDTSNQYWIGGGTSGYSGTRTATYFYLNSAGDTWATGSSRAPIFYDSNDTNYYIDPASTSNTALRMRGGALFGPNTTWGAYLSVGTNGHASGSYASVAATNGNLHLDAASGYTTYINYYAGSSVYFGNGASGGNYAQIASDGSFRSPIFYDFNDTAYYGDFASNSKLYTLEVNGANANASSDSTFFVSATSSNDWGIYLSKPSWEYGIRYNLAATHTYGIWGQKNGTEYFRVGTDQGYHSASFRAPIFYDSDNTAYYGDFASTSNLNVLAVQRAYAGYDAGVTGSFSCNAWFRSQGNTGWYNESYGGGIYMIDSTWVRVYNNKQFYADSFIQSDSSVRAPIFYDSNDTTFYVDPNGGSVLTNVYTYNSGYGFYARYTAGSNSYTGYYNWYGLQLGNNGANYIVAGRTAGGGNLRIYVNNTGDFPGTLGGTHSSTFDSDGIFYNYFSVRTPIFYDSNNTGYYVDPNSTSQLHYVLADNWFRPQGNTGVFWQSYSYYLYKNPDTYGNLRLGENPQNSYVGIQYFYSSSRSTTMFDSGGNGGLYNYTYWIYYWSVGNACLGVKTSTTSSSYALYVDGGIYATGNITAYSDARKKTNIVTVDNALGLVNKMRGVFYNRIDSYDQKIDTNKRQVGVIAQEVNEVLPEVVTYAKDVDEYGVQYGNLAGVFIEAIKELTAKVTALEAKLAEVK